MQEDLGGLLQYFLALSESSISLLAFHLANKIFPSMPLRQLKEQLPIFKLRFPARVFVQTTRSQF